ncbi:MAG: Rid family detoxifying hydrolase [Anaerovoracaceae bacterium]|nr:Rid family detoxifying hydrolase [Anaerovoracaceae bacterium]
MVKNIVTDKAPQPIGPYTEGKDLGDVVYLAGQGGFDPATGKVVEGGVQAECEQCCKNVQALLNEVGLGLEDVVENTCFLVDMNDFEAFNEAYAKYFTGKPARTCIAVRELPAGIKCEIKSIAYRSK